jgi:cell filamentation protein
VNWLEGRLGMKSEKTATKSSIRFFNEKEVRAVWDEANSKWWFNAIDIVAILNEQDDYTKTGNYWRWLKRKMIKEKNESVSAAHRLKFTAADGKKYLTDASAGGELEEKSHVQKTGDGWV